MKGKRRFDFILLIVALALVGIGIVMVYSTSAIMAGDRFGDPYYFLEETGPLCRDRFRPDDPHDVLPL